MKNKTFLIGFSMLFALFLAAIIGPWLPTIQNGMEKRISYMEDGEMKIAPFPPDKDYPFGTDRDGRSLLSLIVLGIKDTLLLIFAITGIRYLIGVTLGLLSSRKKGFFAWLVNLLSQLFSGFPAIFAALLLLNMPFMLFSEQRMLWVILFLAVIEMGRVAELAQEQAYQVSISPYYEGGVAVGIGLPKMIRNYYLPNILPVVITGFFLDLARVTMLVGQLGLLSVFMIQQFVQEDIGYGNIVNTSYNWPGLLASARVEIAHAIWIPMFPALAITYLIFSFHFMGEGLRRHFERN